MNLCKLRAGGFGLASLRACDEPAQLAAGFPPACRHRIHGVALGRNIWRVCITIPPAASQRITGDSNPGEHLESDRRAFRWRRPSRQLAKDGRRFSCLKETFGKMK